MDEGRFSQNIVTTSFPAHHAQELRCSLLNSSHTHDEGLRNLLWVGASSISRACLRWPPLRMERAISSMQNKHQFRSFLFLFLPLTTICLSSTHSLIHIFQLNRKQGIYLQLVILSSGPPSH